MATKIRSYAKINLGLRIGPRRADGFHDLRTMYSTLSLYEPLSVEVAEGQGITVICRDPRVPRDESNTCYRAAQFVMQALGLERAVEITIDKQLPVQGGLGAASGNAVATIFALERALSQRIEAKTRAEIAARIGSDLKLFLNGGLTLGTGRGKEVLP